MADPAADAAGVICLGAAILGAQITLAWTHSVERTEWRETWRARDGLLHLVEARVRGSGAGMEPGPDARLVDGWYVWAPSLAVREVRLARSTMTADWRICSNDACRPPPADADLLRAC